MNHLASSIHDLVHDKLQQALAGNAEGRLIFHGPPPEIMSSVFEMLAGSSTLVPVLLLLPALAPGEANPPAGASGPCDDTHLLNLRNSPSQPTFLALVPPGQHSMRSVTSTTDEFGVAASNNGGNVAFEDWWADEFIQDLVKEGIARCGLHDQAQREEARVLVGRAAAAADELDPERTQRGNAWRVISRLFESAGTETGLAPGTKISLACGMPPLGDGSLAAREQLGVLEKVADAMSDGFGPGIRRAKDNADQEDLEHLDAFLAHLRSVCDLPTAFERATATYYAPGNGLELPVVPDWWIALTAEKWTELLTEDAGAQGDIHISCSNPLVHLGKGMPIVVEGGVALAFEAVGARARGTVLAIERGPRGNEIGKVVIGDGDAILMDESLPQHRSPMRYAASAPGFKPGTIKVISLSTWQPGIFVACRLARKLTPPRRPPRRQKSTPGLETSMVVPGGGRYEILVFTSPGIRVDPVAEGTGDDVQDRIDTVDQLPVRNVRTGHHQIEVEAETNYQLDIGFERDAVDGSVDRETCRLFISVEDVVEQGCRSEFERLIRVNRRLVDSSDAKPVVQLNRSARCSSLQDWMLAEDAVDQSFLPVVLANDYVDAWVQKPWGAGTGPIFSSGRFLHDPRPDATEFQPPAGFLEARRKIAARIRGTGDQTGLAEAAELGKWLRGDEEFRSLVETYLDSYAAWLAASPDVACWVDVAVVTTLEDDGRTLARIPDAIILSPLHPLRIAWQSLAQEVLLEADTLGKPCPAASVLDPDCVPDVLTMSLRSPGGIEHVDYLAVENGTDYWSVLWNGDRLGRLPSRSKIAPFGDAFGISVGGISVGFSAAQVARALDDVSGLLAAKPVVGLVVESAGGTTDACNEGLVEWCSNRYRDGNGRTPRQAAGPRLVEIYDHRSAGSRPDDATIANLSEDTRNSVRWFDGQPARATPDLGIIAQLDMSEPSAAAVAGRSPLGHGGLLRHRVRRQLPGAFLSETRQSLPANASGSVLADKIGACIATMENLGERRTGLRFAPNVNVVRDMLESRNAEFVAVSSSAIDPACFLGGWLENAYLWDYDMPSYSHRAGDTNGYYLLSKVKQADREALAKVLARLPSCAGMDGDSVQDLLLEIARRGIPTIRGLSSDNHGATGDLGLFVAVRLLQDRFRQANLEGSLLPVIDGEGEDVNVCIIVPVDPFRGYFADLARSLGKDRKETSLSRPDLLVIGARFSGGQVRIHLTPVEVKCRLGSTFPASEVGDALEQAKTFSRLLSNMLPHEGQPVAWALGFQHLLLSIIGFGMRVYSQHPDVAGREAQWSAIHERIAAAILGPVPCVSVDQRGRLIIVDDSPRSGVRDRDDDGFDETVTIGNGDAGFVVAGDPASFYAGVRERVGQWGFLPDLADPLPVPSPRLAIEAAMATTQATEAGVAVAAGPSASVVSPPASSGLIPGTERSPSDASRGVLLSIGTTIDSFRPGEIGLNVSDTRLNQLNMGVVGDLGTGKTQLLKSLILQIASSAADNRGIQPRFLIFDYKRDYSSPDFVAATGARVVKPHRLPLNLFDTSGLGDVAAPWLDRFRFFADVLDKIYTGIGPVQRDKLKRAVRSAYESSPAGRPPTLRDVHAAYAELLDGKSDSPMAIIDDLIDMEIFVPDAGDAVPFDQFLDGVVVVSLDALGQDDRSKNMLVAIMLNMFYENMLRVPKRPFIGEEPQLRAIDSYLLVDEADNIMRYEFDVLRKLLLQGREFGTGVILASQYLRHFKVNATDYREPLLTWFIHKVPNVTPAELSALGLTGGAADLAERVKSLKVHQCLYKSFDVSGEIVKGLPFFELQARSVTGGE
ncbi:MULTISPECIES: ATP-binding protein [unclassified Rhizobium]|uniref:ATP-binding protein n=1 Tax=unclassified Rhizobium TaxID=2613769 RepID=UPI001B3250C0|nr:MULTISPECIES: ATP-binding protein [unclassified Rhizobium]MBX5256888.1 ATP-binding protein [Rhizobium sp. NLR16b]MBX5262980.1 ATP-binding protein [Rhizobium sp. NLR16a]MBX5311545.1 ATP-binding protein [Rhizobium sp. NLR11b]QTU95943.1 ATP-binding protein [Rhizobium sp. NLR16a]